MSEKIFNNFDEFVNSESVNENNRIPPKKLRFDFDKEVENLLDKIAIKYDIDRGGAISSLLAMIENIKQEEKGRSKL